MTTIQGNLGRRRAAGRERGPRLAAIEQAGIDEPVNHAELEAAAKAEANQDADLEI
jgi:hypothetical protein